MRKAYLQIQVHPSLVHFQVVVYQGKLYVMQRMGFGLNIAPKVMDTVIKFVLSEYSGTDNYVDDLLVPTTMTAAVKVKLDQYGLQTKPE